MKYTRTPVACWRCGGTGKALNGFVVGNVTTGGMEQTCTICGGTGYTMHESFEGTEAEIRRVRNPEEEPTNDHS